MFPKNPETIIIKHQFYQHGLREIDIWNHYIRFKNSIINQSINRDLMFFIKVDGILVKRKGKTTNFIRLNQSNYEEMITGRTLSIHATMHKTEDIAVVDIDTDDFNKAKEATRDCYDVLKKYPIFQKIQIRFSGKTSFHIFCNLTKKINIDSIRYLLEKIFRTSEIINKYTISKARSGSTPNIDLFRNTYRGGYILLNSLSTIGLQCMEVSYNDLNNFMKEKSIIK